MAEKENSNKKSETALREEKVLEFWRENKIFEKTLKQSEGKKEFIFYDGPVTANSRPVLHTMEPFSFKDAIPRYKTMRGYHVRRKGGWDTHGLPVELQIEKKLGFKSKNDIENYGIAAFNRLCRESVWDYIELWKNFTNRIGYWADQENPYVTYHNDFIESVWSIVKKINEQKLLYKDYKVVPWCPRCGTALSSHELAQGYEDVKDLSVYVKFKVVGQENTYILAWTTTPWTLPGNVALAVNKNVEYVKVKIGNETLILAKAKISLIGENQKIIEEIKGSDLIGLEYEPLFPYLKEQLKQRGESAGKAFKVYDAKFVTTEDGTGVVHTAVMYGQDDFELGTKVGLPKFHLVNPEGKFIKGTGFLEGRFVKEKDENNKPTLDIDIVKYLTDNNLFFSKENYQHSYPHCWRCKTALIYYARDSWYIRMSDQKIKKQLIEENKTINWEPSHIRDGRFGEWLREIKDWAISRERYWGTPLPVWVCDKCEKKHVVGSLEEIKERTKKSGNKYFVVRHGEADSNVREVVDSSGDENNKITENGIQEIKNSAKKLKDEKFDVIFCSSARRTKETAHLIAEVVGFDKNKIIFDERLEEYQVGDLDGKNIIEYKKYVEENIKSVHDYFTSSLPNGESRLSVHKRMGDFIYEIEKEYSNKKILIISHGDPIMALFLTAKGYNSEKIKEEENNFDYFKTGEIRELNFAPIPHDENFKLDLHRPYIDNAVLFCECGENMTRTREVMDVWFDSGAMPFAQDHYPFENKKWVDGEGYPADFISEAIDQTRGWFYTLHAIGVLMERGKAYKNVICLGHLLDAKGKKMSKSLGNIVDPWEAMDKYGVDTLRLWMYSVNQPGESKNFDEKTVALLSQQVFGLLYNVLAFYELYRDQKIEKDSRPKSENILDLWILARLDELVKLSTENLDNYKLLEPTRAIRDFVGDLSTWYLRRSRERIKNGEENAKQTLYFALKTVAKLLAPLAPFAAEDIWLKLKTENDVESVHLAEWPEAEKINEEIIKNMQITRDICTAGNAERQKANIPVRQPLQTLYSKVGVSEEYYKIIKDELNVKNVVVKNIVIEFSEYSIVELDTKITPELKAEGDYRELVRALQDMRKKMGLTPNEIVMLSLDTGDEGKRLAQKFENEIKKTVLVSKIEFKKNNGQDPSTNSGQEIKIGELTFKVEIEKI